MTTFRRIAHLLPGLAFVGFLSLPLAQTLSGFAPVKALGGTVAEEPARAERSLAAWHDGAIQVEIEATLVKQLGLRDWIVRLDNQLKFWLFRTTKRPVVRGPDDWLFEDGYLTAKTHATLDSTNAILANAYGLALSQQILAEHGITQIVLVSPSKTETLPEHLAFPHRQVHEAGHPRDIDVVQEVLRLGYLNHFDAQALFTRWHATEPDFALFPRSGTHWSHVAATRVVVGLLDTVETVGHVDVPSFDLADVRLGSTTGASEDDMVVMANLLVEAGLRDPMPVPSLKRRTGDQAEPCGLLFVTSSFGWLPLDYLSRTGAFSPLTVYYYFRSAYDYRGAVRGEKRSLPDGPDALREEISKHKVVVVESNVSMLRGLGYGFADAVQKAFGPPTKPVRQPTAAEVEKVQAVVKAPRGAR